MRSLKKHAQSQNVGEANNKDRREDNDTRSDNRSKDALSTNIIDKQSEDCRREGRRREVPAMTGMSTNDANSPSVNSARKAVDDDDVLPVLKDMRRHHVSGSDSDSSFSDGEAWKTPPEEKRVPVAIDSDGNTVYRAQNYAEEYRGYNPRDDDFEPPEHKRFLRRLLCCYCCRQRLAARRPRALESEDEMDVSALEHAYVSLN